MLLTIVYRFFGFLSVIMLIAIFFNDSWADILAITALFFVVSCSGLICPDTSIGGKSTI